MDRPERCPEHSDGVPAKSWWRLSHCSKTTPVSTNERDAPQRVVSPFVQRWCAQSHCVIQADDVFCFSGVQRMQSLRKSLVLLAARSTHLISIQRGTPLEKRQCTRMSSQLEKKYSKSFVHGDMAMTLVRTGRKQITWTLSVWNSPGERPQSSSLSVPLEQLQSAHVTFRRVVSEKPP